MINKKNQLFHGITAIFLAIFVVLFLACGASHQPVSQPAVVAQPVPVAIQPVTKAEPDQLDMAVRETSDYLNKNIKAGNKLVILNIQSDFPVLSEYIIDELIANTVNDRIFTIVDRQQLDAIRTELEFQMSGEVDDNSAQRLGKMLGAQTIISGGITKIGDIYRLRVRALSVESAQIEGQFNRNISSGSTIEMLVKSSPNSRSIQTASSEQIRLAVPVTTSHGPTASPSVTTVRNSSETEYQDDKVGIEMVFVKGGIYTMGCSNEQEDDCWSEATPAHKVTVSDFYIGKYEITQKQWVQVMNGSNWAKARINKNQIGFGSSQVNSNPSHFKGDDLPVTNVSWNDIQEFLSELYRITGRRYRLPTEAEWEYAARGGSNSRNFKYSGSNHINDVAWYINNSFNKMYSVGTKSPNELGIYDMSGNAWEWVGDKFGSYSASTQTNPTGPSSGSTYVVRGGSWRNEARNCTVSFRASRAPGPSNAPPPDFRDNHVGFRLVLSP
jgi:formylglycine-generating enzyme required for sulfatase activity